MKVRFGFTVGPEMTPSMLGPISRDLERLDFDSLWVPEVLLQPTLDPMVSLAFAAARTRRLKLGTHLIVPGRHPVHLARQLAHLDQLSGGRLLILAVLGLADEADAGAQGIDRTSRGRAIAEVVPLLRRLWGGEPVDHDGPVYQLNEVTVLPRPRQEPLEIWLAGQAPAALERCGRLGDGWMPGSVYPHEAAALRPKIEEAAADAGRAMDPEHYGANLFYATGPIPACIAAKLGTRRPDAASLVPIGWDALRQRVSDWEDAGFSKFLLRPVVPPVNWTEHLEELAAEVLPMSS